MSAAFILLLVSPRPHSSPRGAASVDPLVALRCE
jgi:hypothetical protein